MGQLQVIESVAEIFTRASQATEIKTGFTAIASLIGRPIYEEEKAIKFDTETGKPTESKWEPYRPWDGRLWLSGLFNYPGLVKTDPLATAVRQQFQLDEAVIGDCNGEKFFVVFVPSSSQAGGDTPEYLQFGKAKEL